MAPVVPLKAHDAAAGAQVCRLLAAPRLAETGQQKRVRAEPVDGGAVYFCLLYKISVECSIRPAEIPPTKYCVPKDEKNYSKKEKAADPPGRSAAFDALFARYLLKNYSAVIAPVGQAPSQAPQSMQASAFTTATPPSTATAPTGQAPSQAPQPTHASETLCAIIELSFISPVLSIYEEICPCTALADPSEIISLTAF